MSLLSTNGYTSIDSPYFPILSKEQLLSVARFELSSIVSDNSIHEAVLGRLAYFARANGYEDIDIEFTKVRDKLLNNEELGYILEDFIDKFFIGNSNNIKEEYMTLYSEPTGNCDIKGKTISYGDTLVDNIGNSWTVNQTTRELPYLLLSGEKKILTDDLVDKHQLVVKVSLNDTKPKLNKYGIDLKEELSYIGHFDKDLSDFDIIDNEAILYKYLEERKLRSVDARHVRFGWNGLEKERVSWRSSGTYTLISNLHKGCEISTDFGLVIMRTNGIAAKKDQRSLAIDTNRYIYYLGEECLLVVFKSTNKDMQADSRGSYLHTREVFFLEFHPKGIIKNQETKKSGNYSIKDLEWLI